MKVTETRIIRRVFQHVEPIALEVKQDGDYPPRYTIIVGPEGNTSNQRVQLSATNFAALQELIAEVRADA